jgi:hypothetical protein
MFSNLPEDFWELPLGIVLVACGAFRKCMEKKYGVTYKKRKNKK